VRQQLPSQLKEAKKAMESPLQKAVKAFKVLGMTQFRITFSGDGLEQFAEILVPRSVIGDHWEGIPNGQKQGDFAWIGMQDANSLKAQLDQKEEHERLIRRSATRQVSDGLIALLGGDEEDFFEALYSQAHSNDLMILTLSEKRYREWCDNRNLNWDRTEPPIEGRTQRPEVAAANNAGGAP
jgi:hypothetical protein